MSSPERSLLRALCRAVIPSGAVLHSSCVEKNSQASLFLGRSGGGKSTIAHLVADGGEIFLLEDDETVVARGTDGTVRCLPTHRIRRLTGVERIPPGVLKNLFFVEKGSDTLVLPVPSKYAFYRAVRIGSFLGAQLLDPNENHALLKGIQSILGGFPCFIVRYSPPVNPHDVIGDML